MRYSGFLTDALLQHQTPLIPTPPQAPQPELLSYSNTPQFSTQPVHFANTDKTISSELPQPIHTVSTTKAVPQDISLISDIHNSDPLCSQFSSSTPSQIANNHFNLPQKPVSNIERLLSHAHWNHSFNIVNSSCFFQNSLSLSFQGTLPIITLSSNLPTPDPDHHSYHCIGEQPDTTRTYPTLPLILDPKFIVPPRALLVTIITVNNYTIRRNNEFLNHIRLQQYKRNKHTIY